MDSRQLRYFLAVVEHGSVTRAAEVLFVAQPALSQSLRGLESELGVELFRRVPRGMELTDAGAALLGPARQVMQSSQHADEVVRGIATLEQGRLDVASPPDLAVEPLASLVARFRARHPGVWVNLIDPGPNADVESLLRNARCEVGVDYLPADDDKLSTCALGRRRLLLGLPPESSHTQPEIFPIDRLADLPLVAGPRGTAVRDEVERICADNGFTPRVAVEVEHEHNVYLLVAAGAGAAFLTESEARRSESRGVRVVRTEPELGHDFGLVFRSGPLSPAARAFVELATAHTKPEGAPVERDC
ncbi:LysR family transcriptional regulator [Rhodococcus sp. USK10]|uniref:LysR family transcriptional regulator n=1 Tax=Rhodococcus sp. USK10 TaxID=2789739 RepID=UPI001C5DCDCD|nr:LysR substrate-binding domain-containing protein [Rhodococcus sp. USK10]QYB06896.1 LysR family transcriptional regulator [Rhodococcus sp. USK10]